MILTTWTMIFSIVIDFVKKKVKIIFLFMIILCKRLNSDLLYFQNENTNTLFSSFQILTKIIFFINIHFHRPLYKWLDTYCLIITNCFHRLIFHFQLFQTPVSYMYTYMYIFGFKHYGKSIELCWNNSLHEKF